MNDRIRLYFDEDSMRRGIVRALRARHFDVVTAFEAQLIKIPDDKHLAYAATQGRVLFTFNRGDFARLHKAYLRKGRQHAGIILSNQLETGVIVRRLLKLLSAKSAADMQNWLEFLGNWR